MEEGTDTDRKVDTQREERQRDREKRDREKRDRETERQRDREKRDRETERRETERQRDREKREEKQRVCTELHVTSGDQYAKCNFTCPVLSFCKTSELCATQTKW